MEAPQLKDVTGRVSRTITTGQLLFLAGAIQSALAVSGLPIPPEYQWMIGVFSAVIGQWIVYLRMNTTTVMK